jgi:ketosteroid isomerase-like protein
MSRENAEVVRQPIALRASSHRRMQERLFLRLPGVAAALTGRVLRLPPSSRVRRTMIRRTTRLAYEALNRGDYEAAFAIVPPDFEAMPAAEALTLGFDPVYRGREGRLRYHRQWVAELGEFEQELDEVIDLGDRVLVLAQMTGTGASSGAAFASEVAYLVTISAGRLIREQDFRSHAQALEAAGLTE